MAKTNNPKTFHWAVIGAGPAGIAAVGKLLDNHILAQDILWIDPHFKVGDLGLLWSQVSSNTKVCYFIDFLEAVNSFAFKEVAHQFQISHLNPEKTCTLNEVVLPLQKVTDHLIQQVESKTAFVDKVYLSERTWTICAKSKTYLAKNVILATGALPTTLNYAGIDAIPFELAIDKDKLSKAVDKNKHYAVFGSSHSAIMIIRNLVELGVKKIVNFYRSPCRYALDMDTWILFDNTGLKGETALWARENIDGTMPSNLVRHTVNDHTIAQHLPECDKVIYAVGFEKRNHIIVGDFEDSHHNPHVGIIGPGLFGLGIAYPELKTDPFGYVESQVGLWKFMVYLNRVLPIWLKYTA